MKYENLIFLFFLNRGEDNRKPFYIMFSTKYFAQQIQHILFSTNLKFAFVEQSGQKKIFRIKSLAKQATTKNNTHFEVQNVQHTSLSKKTNRTKCSAQKFTR